MRFVRGIFLHFLFLSFHCSALPVHEHVHQKIARVQSGRPIHIGPLERAASAGSGEDAIPHAHPGGDTDTGTGTIPGSVDNVNIHQNPPPSIPVIHPAVDLANGTATLSSNNNNNTTAHDSNGSVSDLLGPDACSTGGECVRLGESIISSGEGPECRALLITGKCSSKCLISLKEAVEHKLWDACTKRCDTDLVTGAASRLVELCQVRQPTLLDASKEALQIVAAAPGAGKVIQAFFILSVLFAGIMFCYRRKNSTMRWFFQKRLKRRSSERSIV